ncbi:MAG: glycine zipper 2TM domain-containing protein [Rhodoferax sp.]|nr:glycine zipper 2TM domain-containing protein [Rhodoferax sp.]
MKTPKTRSILASGSVAVLIALGACSGMTTREKNTAIGAGVGAAAGAVLSNGSVLGTGVGAAAGGVIGNQMKK